MWLAMAVSLVGSDLYLHFRYWRRRELEIDSKDGGLFGVVFV